MREIDERIKRITPGDRAAAEAARKRWNAIAKPLGSLGLLEEAIVRIAALRSSADVRLDRRALLGFCADHGVTARGVTQCGSEVTARVAVALAEGRSSVSPLAARAGCRVVPADMGVRDFPGHPGVVDLRVKNGTDDISLGPAMSRADCLLAVERGARLAEKEIRAGAALLAVGEMGIGNTTSAAALACALLGLSPERAVGRGAGLSAEGLARKRRAVQMALEVNKTDPDDVVSALSGLGGLEIAAMCGAFLGAASCRTPVIVDGVISAAAALCAVRLCPAAGDALLASHVSKEPVGRALLEATGLRAPLDAGMYLGEGAGAVLLMPLLDMALGLYNSGQSFDLLGIEAYKPQSGGEEEGC